MTSALDALPPEIAKLINPRWRQNELEYWRQRDQLLAHYKDRWIGFADGKVISEGKSAVAVFHEAMQQGATRSSSVSVTKMSPQELDTDLRPQRGHRK